MKSIDRLSWGSPAAYLYALKLDTVSLAWEYLRRNREYQCDFYGAVTLSRNRTPERWCLRQWEDPQHDSRLVEPIWRADAREVVTVVRGQAGKSVPAFGFWALPGHKALRHDGVQLSLTARVGGQVRRVSLSADLGQGDPFALSISAGHGFLARAQAAYVLTQSFDSAFPAAMTQIPRRPSPRAVTHMQILQALDADAAGATLREIARAVFGAFTEETWGPDSVWRARVRHLLDRGREQCTHGYRQMAGADEGVGRRSHGGSSRNARIQSAKCAAVHNQLTR